MVEPKMFYRELDSILAQIRREKTDQNFLFSILNELEKRFGNTLQFHNSHVYEQRGNDFVLLRSSNKSKTRRTTPKLSLESEVVQLVLTHGSYIYDNHALSKHFELNSPGEFIVPAAIHIHISDRRWLFVIELCEGWSREEVSLFLNTVRMSINYRLFSEMINGELEKAALIQQSLLPIDIPKIKGFQIAGRSQPAEIVGGDFYDYFQFDEESFGVSIGDASGHGLPAALLVRDVVIGLRMGLAKEMRLVYTIEKLNKIIQKSTYPTTFVSIFVGELEWDGHFFYVNAGHPPPILVTQDKIHDLEATGIALGFLPEISLRRSYVYLEKDSILVLFSDGIIERENDQEERFGIRRLKELITKNKNKDAEKVLEIVFNHVYDFGNRSVWADDASLVIVKRTLL